MLLALVKSEVQIIGKRRHDLMLNGTKQASAHDHTPPRTQTGSHLGGHRGGPYRGPKFHNLCHGRRVNDGIEPNGGLVQSILRSTGHSLQISLCT